MNKGSEMALSCGVCHRRFKYKDLIIEPSWNGKWKVYLTPCSCHTESWMAVSDLVKGDPHLLRAYKV